MAQNRHNRSSRDDGAFDFHDLVFLAKLQMAHTELDEIFDLFDSDGDGMISAQELRDTMASLGHDLSDAELAEMLREADTDGDGIIDEQKFKAMMRRGAGVGIHLKDTLKLVTEQCGLTGEKMPRHRPLPALIGATKAIAAASRFCGVAFAAAATTFAPHTSAETLKLQTKCVGTQLWALTVAKLILSERSVALPAVSFALPSSVPRTPDQCDVDGAIVSLRVKLDEWMQDSRQELKRRHHVRVSVECGETAMSTRRAAEALGLFEQAKELATGVEITQLDKLITSSTKEKERQTTVQGLHEDANVALEKPDGARTAIARYDAALRPPLEHEERSPEH